jgi:hypothetical protein
MATSGNAGATAATSSEATSGDSRSSCRREIAILRMCRGSTGACSATWPVRAVMIPGPRRGRCCIVDQFTDGCRPIGSRHCPRSQLKATSSLSGCQGSSSSSRPKRKQIAGTALLLSLTEHHATTSTTPATALRGGPEGSRCQPREVLDQKSGVTGTSQGLMVALFGSPNPSCRLGQDGGHRRSPSPQGLGGRPPNEVPAVRGRLCLSVTVR